MSRPPSLTEQPKLMVTTAGLILVVLLGLLDFVTGPQISFSVFYLLPISLVTWFANRQGGITTAIFSAITWLVADLTSAISYTHYLIPFWNAIVRLIVFLVIVLLGSALKNLNQDLEKRVKDRTASLEEEVAERKKVESRIQQYAKRLEILHEIDQAILAAESLEAIAHSTIKHVRNMLNCEHASLILLDFDTQIAVLFELSAESNKTEPLERHIPMEKIPDLNAVLDLLRQDDIHLTNNSVVSPLKNPIIQFLQAKDYLSIMIVPILVHYELIGSLNLMSYHSDVFSPEDREVGREIANQLGIAINQARMINQLRTDQESLQALSQQLLAVQESERRNIARELHDEVGQALTGIGVTLEMANNLRKEARTESIKQAHLLVVELMERVSKLSLELRPALLDDLGLLPALLWHFDRYTAQTNIDVAFKHNGIDERRFAPETETAAYRIVQEALTNVARHARVNETWVTVWYDQNTLGIQVEDEGQGFDSEMMLVKRNSGGLLGMRERAILLNGKLTIETAKGAGTRLFAELPTTELIKD